MTGTRILQDRVAIVTGAGGGLGRCHALELARHGAKLLVNDLNGEAAQRVADEIIAAGGQAMAMPGSVTDETAVEEIVARIMDSWGRIDILVNNAGILRDKSFAKMSIDDFRLVIEVHLMGAAIFSKAVWPVMREQQYGRIVMTTSSSGLYGNFGQANYGAAKMALVGLMQTLAIEGEKYNIRVNSLAPTAATQMTDGVLASEALTQLDPALVSPGVVALVAEEGPSRAILCAGAGNFAAANITLTRGLYVGRADDAAAQVIDGWDAVTDREGEAVPPYGFFQAERELAASGAEMPAMAVAR